MKHSGYFSKFTCRNLDVYIVLILVLGFLELYTYFSINIGSFEIYKNGGKCYMTVIAIILLGIKLVFKKEDKK